MTRKIVRPRKKRKTKTTMRMKKRMMTTRKQKT
jgi:hypothetical protein